jgi:hypothetical protein
MLFKDTAKLKEYCELTSSNFVSLKATLRHVEDVRLVPLLGKEQYKALNDAYTAAANETTLTEAQQALLEQCRKVVAPYLAYHYTPKAEVKLDDGGARRMETTTSKTAYKDQVARFREANQQEAEQQSEMLLEFLDENKADYPLWEAGKAFTQYKQLFIKTGFSFNEIFPSHSPYRNYWAMRSKMLQVEQLHIKKEIGETLFDDLKTKDQAANLTDQEQKLLTKLKNAIAYFTVALSIPYLTVRIDANGITVTDTGSSGSNDELNKLKSAPDAKISLLMSEAKSTGETWLNDAIDFLTNNAADFNNWNEEEDTEEIDTTTAITDANTGLNGAFIM